MSWITWRTLDGGRGAEWVYGQLPGWKWRKPEPELQALTEDDILERLGP